MPSTPDEVPASHLFDEATRRYSQAWTRINQMIRQGVSWSGHERNCCFLNKRTTEFADIAALSGLDFLDDGRASAAVDWDHDGKLDLWLSNRTGPRVRFMHNEFNSKQHFLAFKLEGSQCNRDAIGARLEITLKNSSDMPLVRTLHAGEGYLGQSDKWIHFGLGTADQIEKLVVHWPGKDHNNPEGEVFTDIKVDDHYQIVQGSSVASSWPLPERNIALTSTQLEATKENGVSRTFFSARIPLPPLRYESIAEERAAVVKGPLRKPLLVNFWGSWCPSCLVELADFRDHQTEIEEANLDILALSVDQGNGDLATHRATAQKTLTRIRFPFQHGLVHPRLLEEIQFLHDLSFDQYLPLPMPTSLLLDKHGDLAALYRGPVSCEQLLEDVRSLDSKEVGMPQASLPFTGIWHSPPSPTSRILPIATMLIDMELLEDAIEFIERHETELATDLEYPDLLSRMAIMFAEKGNKQAAEEQYRALVRAIPDHAPSLYNLAILLKDRGELQEALELLQKAKEVQPEFQEVSMALGIILELQEKHDEALIQFTEVLHLNPKHVDAQLNVAILLYRQGQSEKSRSHFEQALLLDPSLVPALYYLGLLDQDQGDLGPALDNFRALLKLDENHTMAHYHTGFILQQQGKNDAAISHYRKAAQNKPDLLELYNNLAWLLATAPNLDDRQGREAVRYAIIAAKATDYSEPAILDTLAAAYAEAGQFQEAVQTAEKGIKLARSSQQEELATKIEQRLQLYKNEKPFQGQ